MNEILVLALVLLQICAQFATSGSPVHRLPGFEGPLPFHLETGYVGVGDSEKGGQVFYYFIESENNPQEDPLMLWLTGGPGCSSFSGLIFEIGPIAFKVEKYNGTLPKLVRRPQAWTKACSIIFVDLPIGSGFSYANTPYLQRGDWTLVNHAHQFIRKWLIDHPRFLSHQVYIGGDSYSGIPVPAMVQKISNGNEKGIQPWINLQGYVLGNPLTTMEEENYLPSFAHGMALISDELYMSLKKNCKGNYINIDPENKSCLRDFNILHELISGLSEYDTLNPKCEMALNTPHGFFSRRSLINKFRTTLISSRLARPPLSCQSYVYFLGYDWIQDNKVQEALHIRKGSKRNWQRCNPFDYSYDITSAFPYHANLSPKGFRSLIYNGDHDPIVPFMSTQAWIRDLNYSIVEDWRPWLVNGQVAGYTRRYSNKMTFATVKGAGHITPEYKPEESFAMFIRWISNTPLW
ncbi:serine carboxypeptidase-like 11, partial [Neltuma alba]